jgi:hypothetical protein
MEMIPIMLYFRFVADQALPRINGAFLPVFATPAEAILVACSQQERVSTVGNSPQPSSKLTR